MIYDVISYSLMILLICYWINVARQIHKDRKKRAADWQKHIDELKELRDIGKKINREWQQELDTWRAKREQLEDAINERNVKQ